MAEDNWMDRMRQISAERKMRASEGNEAAHIPKKKSSVKYRIDDTAGSQLLLWAGMFDVLSCIPLVNTVVVFFAQFCFFVFFNFFYGVPTFGKRTWIWYLVAWVVELIPFLSIFPTYSLMVFRMIAISRIEDRAKSMLIDVESDKAKAVVDRMLKSKKVQDFAAKQQQTPIKRKDGSRDTDKEAGRQARIGGARTNLDASLQKKTADANSGVKDKGGKSEPYQDYLTGKDYNAKDYGLAGKLARPALYGSQLTSLGSGGGSAGGGDEEA